MFLTRSPTCLSVGKSLGRRPSLSLKSASSLTFTCRALIDWLAAYMSGSALKYLAVIAPPWHRRVLEFLLNTTRAASAEEEEVEEEEADEKEDEDEETVGAAAADDEDEEEGEEDDDDPVVTTAVTARRRLSASASPCGPPPLSSRTYPPMTRHRGHTRTVSIGMT
jgi:hypothetical protein